MLLEIVLAIFMVIVFATLFFFGLNPLLSIFISIVCYFIVRRFVIPFRVPSVTEEPPSEDNLEEYEQILRYLLKFEQTLNNIVLNIPLPDLVLTSLSNILNCNRELKNWLEAEPDTLDSYISFINEYLNEIFAVIETYAVLIELPNPDSEGKIFLHNCINFFIEVQNLLEEKILALCMGDGELCLETRLIDWSARIDKLLDPEEVPVKHIEIVDIQQFLEKDDNWIIEDAKDSTKSSTLKNRSNLPHKDKEVTKSLPSKYRHLGK